MPSMYDMMYGNSTPDTQQGYGRMNMPMIQMGQRMMGGQPFGMQTLPYRGGAQGQMQNLPYASGGPTPQMQDLVQRAPSGRRRIRIGNKTYEEVDDSAQQQAPSAPAAQY